MFVTFVPALSMDITAKMKIESLILLTFHRPYVSFLMALICQCFCHQLNCQSSLQNLQTRNFLKFTALIPNISHLETIYLGPSLRLNLTARLEIRAFRKRRLNFCVPDRMKNLLVKRTSFYWNRNQEN